MPIVASASTATAGHLSCAASVKAAQTASAFVMLSRTILTTRPTVPEKYEIARAGSDHAAVVALRRAGGWAAAVVLTVARESGGSEGARSSRAPSRFAGGD